MLDSKNEGHKWLRAACLSGASYTVLQNEDEDEEEEDDDDDDGDGDNHCIK